MTSSVVEGIHHNWHSIMDRVTLEKSVPWREERTKTVQCKM